MHLSESSTFKGNKNWNTNYMSESLISKYYWHGNMGHFILDGEELNLGINV